MDGFVQQQNLVGARCLMKAPFVCVQDELGRNSHDAMGYHTDAEIPNYWSYARHFVLQDHLFEGYRSWSFPSHLDLVSEWVAVCTDPHNAMT